MLFSPFIHLVHNPLLLHYTRTIKKDNNTPPAQQATGIFITIMACLIFVVVILFFFLLSFHNRVACPSPSPLCFNCLYDYRDGADKTKKTSWSVSLTVYVLLTAALFPPFLSLFLWKQQTSLCLACVTIRYPFSLVTKV